MSLKTKVKNAVDIAFEKLKDLSVNVTFNTKLVSDFDFDTGSVIKTDQQYSTIGFIETLRSYEGGIPVTSTRLTIKNDPTKDFNRYSEVTINSQKYGCNVISRDEFVVILSLAGV